MTYIPSTISSSSVTITGGTVDNTTIGANNPSTAKVTSLVNSGAEVDAVRIVTTGSSTTQLSTDRILIINKTSGSPTTVNLISSPATGLRLIIKDGKGDALLNPISVLPAAGLIDGQSAIPINVSFGAIEVCYNGTQWNVIDSVGITVQQIIAPITITESTEGTFVSNTSQTIYASQTAGFAAPIAGPFDTFALTANPGQILVNGQADPVTSNVVSLVYHGHRVFQNISAGDWFYRNTHGAGTSLNLIQNSTNVAAVAGTPGTLPTSWGSDLSGTTQTIVGFGTDTTTGASLPYIDIKLTGTSTTTGADILFGTSTGILVSAGANYCMSAYVSLIAGSLTNITFPSLLWNENNASNGYLSTKNSGITITGTLQQFFFTQATTAGAASLQPQLNLGLSGVGAAINATFRIAGVQFVAGTTPPSPFLPTPASALAWTPCPTPLPSVATINIGVQVDVPIGDAFYVSGSLQGYGSPPTLQYADNGGSWVSFPSNATISTTGWTFLHPSVGASTSNMVISVRDAVTTSVTASSNFFAIYTSSTATISSLSISNTTFLGSAASGTVVGTLVVNMAGGKFTGSLALSGANAASFALVGNNLVTSGVVAAGTYNVTITATMTGAINSGLAGGAVITGDTTSVVPPSQAISAGYKTPVMIDNFTANSFGSNWFSYGLATPLTTSVNTTATQAYITTTGTGTLTLTTDTSAGGRLAFQTAGSGAPPISTQANPIFLGQRLFQYGYFEASVKFSQTGYSGSGSWPSFWGNAGAPHPYIEIGFMEGKPAASTAGSPTTINSTIRNWNAAGTVVTNGTTTVTSPSIVYTNFNTYGCLWTPTSIAFYINNTQVSFTSATNPTPTGTGTPYPAAAYDAISVILGTGVGWTTTVDFVHIFQ